MTYRLSLLMTILGLLVGTAAAAQPLPSPTGPVVLTVSGDIAVTNSPSGAEFDLQMLAAIGTTRLTTSTIWTKGEAEFIGTPLRALLDRLGVADGKIDAVGLNSYSAQIPIDGIEESAPILAWMVDGTYLPVRQRGPIWIIYPYDSEARYRTDLIYARSVWQLVSLHLSAEVQD